MDTLVSSLQRHTARQNKDINEIGLLSDVSLDTGGGMLEVQMETLSLPEAVSGLQERMVQDAAVLADGDFKDEVLVRRPVVRA